MIIGGGPGGLVAAWTAASLGANVILFERLHEPGMLSHPCGCMFAPMKGLATFRLENGGIHFKELDMMIPEEVVIGFPNQLNFISPSGYTMGGRFDNPKEVPVFQLNKSKLLVLLAEKTKEAGANLRYGVHVKNLVFDNNGNVSGVSCQSINGKEVKEFIIKSSLIICAEGFGRRLSQQIGLYDGTSFDLKADIVCYYMEGLSLSNDQEGQTTLLGGPYLKSPPATLAFMSEGRDRAQLHYAVIYEGADRPYSQPIADYADNTIAHDSRLKDLIQGGKVVSKLGCRLPVVDGPSSTIAHGFIGVGDTVNEGGHLANAGAMALGYRAAEVAVNALAANDVSIDALSPYDGWQHLDDVKALQVEAKMMTSMPNMTDEDLDRMCKALSGFNLMPLMFGSGWEKTKATAWLFISRLGTMIRERKLLRQLF